MLTLPLRVHGTDMSGASFNADGRTLLLNRHGAKIRLVRQLVLEQEVRILCHPSELEAIFRVISAAGESDAGSTFWGVECLNFERNIWAIDFPQLRPMDQISVRVMLQCPECNTREVMHLTEQVLQTVRELGGLVRGCYKCGKSEPWKQVPYVED